MFNTCFELLFNSLIVHIYFLAFTKSLNKFLNIKYYGLRMEYKMVLGNHACHYSTKNVNVTPFIPEGVGRGGHYGILIMLMGSYTMFKCT